MENTTQTGKLEIQVCGPNMNHPSTGCAFRIHAANCSHAKRDMKAPVNFDGNGWKMEASTLREIAIEIYSAQIDEGSMTEEDALSDVDFCNCVKLPLE